MSLGADAGLNATESKADRRVREAQERNERARERSERLVDPARVSQGNAVVEWLLQRRWLRRWLRKVDWLDWPLLIVAGFVAVIVALVQGDTGESAEWTITVVFFVVYFGGLGLAWLYRPLFEGVDGRDPGTAPERRAMTDGEAERKVRSAQDRNARARRRGHG